MTRLAYLVSHPIQYQAPMLRRIAEDPDIDLHVLFMSDFSLRTYKDEGFGVEVKWDVPLVEGYSHEFLPFRGEPVKKAEDGFRVYGLEKIIRRDRFDVLWSHGYSSPINLKAMLIARSRGIPVLCRSDNQRKSVLRGRTGALKEAIVRQVLRIPSAFLSVGTLNDAYYGEMGVPKARRFLMPYAIDNERFHREATDAGATRDLLREEIGLEPGRPIVLYASKFIARKRPGDLLRAFEKVVERGRVPRPYLLYVGDGEEYESVREAVPEGLRDDVRFLGFQNQKALPRFFDLCDVFVLPAAAEPFALVVNEVMCAGKAIVLTDEVGCHADLVRPGENGHVYPMGDIEALARALEDILSSEARSASMGRRSWEIIRDWDFEADVRVLRQAIDFVRGGYPKADVSATKRA